jgi:hypothetical protein
LVVLLAVAAVGCKSGSSWTAKPSWWTFGGSGEDPAKLAAAPPATTDATKPSATAKPYPTTTTPQMQLSSIALLEQRQDLVQFTLHSLLYK